MARSPSVPDATDRAAGDGRDDDKPPLENHVDKQLDHGLDETFPASDPVSIDSGSD